MDHAGACSTKRRRCFRFVYDGQGKRAHCPEPIAAVGWTSWNITSSLPYWPVNPALAATPWFELQLDFVRSLWAILPAAFLR